MDSDYTEPQEEDIQSQTDDTGIQPWEPPKVSSTGLLTPNYGILEVAPGPRQNVNFDPMSAFDNATTMHYNQSAAPVDDMLYPGGYQVSLDPRSLHSHNRTLSLDHFSYDEFEHAAEQQANDPQAIYRTIEPSFMSARTDLAMAIDESTPHHSVDNTSTPTIGYVCDKEDSGYVFKCGNCACSDKSYGRWADLKRHYEGAHAGVRRATYWCEVQGCDRSQAYGDQPFRRKDHLTLHVRKVHPDPKRIFPGLEFDICVSGDAGSWAC